MQDDMITVEEAAVLLNLKRRRVQVFVQSGRIPAIKKAHVWLMKRADVEQFNRTRRGAGRPRNTES